MTQKEFDAEMMRLNRAQAIEKLTYEVEIEEIETQKRMLLNEIDERCAKIRALKSQVAERLQGIKGINIKYHTMKHQLCVENPKSSMTE